MHDIAGDGTKQASPPAQAGAQHWHETLIIETKQPDAKDAVLIAEPIMYCVLFL